MATENPNLPAPEERVSDAAEDVQTVTSEVTSEVPETEASAAAEAEPVVETPAAEEPETEKSVAGTPAAEVPVAEAPAAEEPVAEPEAAPRAKRARIKPVAEAVETESGEEAVPAGAEVDFADEEAALAAQDAGLELEGETAEEAAADQLAQEAPSAEDKFAGKGKEELVALFMRMLEEQPVQSIRRDVEALKIAFYRIRRAEVEAARRKFVEEGGSEEDFAPAVDGAEVQLKELFKEYRHRRDEFIANLEAEKEKNLQVKLGIIEELKELVNVESIIAAQENIYKYAALIKNLKDDAAATGHAIIEVCRGENCILIYGGANQEITTEQIDHTLKAFSPGDWLVLQNEISNLPYLMQAAQKKGLSIFFNAAPYDVGILTYPMELVDVLCVNEVEACALAGTETFEADAVLTLLHEKYPQTRLLLTAGSAGSYYLDAERRLFVPCEKVQAVDTTAAGDTYSGYFLAGLCSGSSVEDAMRLATKAAGIAVQRKGAAASIPEIKELK